ncbi:uncharacterized protein LOC132866836 isoform X2 [Neoarius graeffei]|uniref:uncharacterized protein LOC132866836 isoform X2 n=1 Tax=Neoarius graeffei TaxID=443677 RepID=UPI00298BD032|nr:uncharacterized protein LOC132866836 isoform X2 [Neoarius graeffei]
MKTLLIITFYLMSGPVHCDDVIGYPGGRVKIDFKKAVNPRSTVYFCKMKTVCEDLITARATVSVLHKDRFTLFKTDGFITLIFRSLSLQDTGLYRYGEIGVWSENIDLKVKSDPCCSETKSVTGYLGESVMISCSYPTEFETNVKSFFKLDDYAGTEVIFIRAKEAYQNGRFSISDDGRSSVFSVIISDVREDDGGVYSCAFRIEGTAVRYHSLFTEIQLQVTGLAQAPVLIFIISVCVTVLLMGGFLLVCQLRSNKTQDSTFVSQQTETNTMTADCENDPPQSQNSIMHLDYQNLNPNTNQSDSVYQTLDPNTNQSDSVYQTLNPNTNQADSVYLNLDPNQSDSVYQTLDPNTNQSDSVYQTLNPNTNQSDSVYQTLDPNTKQSNSVYQTLNPTISQIQSTRV